MSKVKVMRMLMSRYQRPEDQGERDDTNGKQSGESIDNQQQQQTIEQEPTEDLDQQMDSIKAAERIGMKASFELIILDISCSALFTPVLLTQDSTLF